MFNLGKKNQHEFGSISVGDDATIKVLNLQRAARWGFAWEVLRLFRDVLLMVALLVLSMVFLIQPVYVDGISMVPELENGERLIVNKMVYYDVKSVDMMHLSRGDIVTFWFPEEPSESFVKRIIGMPGETVEITGGEIFIDGKKLYEPYLEDEYNTKVVNRAAVKVPNSHFYVMGDNRDKSDDSRRWGMVPSKYIYGRVVFRYWGPFEIGRIVSEKPFFEDDVAEDE